MFCHLIGFVLTPVPLFLKLMLLCDLLFSHVRLEHLISSKFGALQISYDIIIIIISYITSVIILCQDMTISSILHVLHPYFSLFIFSSILSFIFSIIFLSSLPFPVSFAQTHRKTDRADVNFCFGDGKNGDAWLTGPSMSPNLHLPEIE